MATLLAMTGLGVTGMEKIRLVYLLDLFEGKREMGQCDLVCVERLWIFGLMLVMLISNSRVVSVVLVLSAVGLHRLNFLLFSFVMQQKILKKIVLVLHTWDERNFFLHFETKET